MIKKKGISFLVFLVMFSLFCVLVQTRFYENEDKEKSKNTNEVLIQRLYDYSHKVDSVTFKRQINKLLN